MSDFFEQAESLLNAGGLAEADIELLRSVPFQFNETSWGFEQNLKHISGKVDSKPCPFGSFVSDENGNRYLLGGVVYGGVSSFVVANILIGMPQIVDGVEEIVMEGNAGDHLYLVINFNANMQDNVLIPGVENITAVSSGIGATIPNNTMPTMQSKSGTYHISLGQFTETSFLPSACGDAILEHCPGSISFNRVVSSSLPSFGPYPTV